MSELYRNILVVICASLLGWGIIRIERIYQYPFFMGSMFISFILPQAFALINNPGPVNQEAMERVLLMSCLCSAACWIGYKIKPHKIWLTKLNIEIDERKLFRAGVALACQGYLFNFLLANTTIQRAKINGSWTGPATIYLFLSQVIYIAFTIFLLQSLKRPKFINIFFAMICVWPLIAPILIGRRQPTMTFIIIVGCSLWLVRRYVPPRWLVSSAIVTLAFVIPLFALIRGGFWNLIFTGNWQEILLTAQKAFDLQQKGDILELRNAALLMDATEKTNMYGLGTVFWDSIIFQYIPGQIVGYDLKESLQFHLLDFNLLQDLYGYKIPIGTTTTGVGDSFMEFGYFGCLTFGLISYIFKHLWISSVYQNSHLSRILYMGLVSPAMVGLTHGIGRFLQEAIFQVFFISLVAYYSKVRD
jgi:hypothetical protein